MVVMVTTMQMNIVMLGTMMLMRIIFDLMLVRRMDNKRGSDSEGVSRSKRRNRRRRAATEQQAKTPHPLNTEPLNR